MSDYRDIIRITRGQRIELVALVRNKITSLEDEYTVLRRMADPSNFEQLRMREIPMELEYLRTLRRDILP